MLENKNKGKLNNAEHMKIHMPSMVGVIYESTVVWLVKPVTQAY